MREQQWRQAIALVRQRPWLLSIGPLANLATIYLTRWSEYGNRWLLWQASSTDSVLGIRTHPDSTATTGVQVLAFCLASLTHLLTPLVLTAALWLTASMVMQSRRPALTPGRAALFGVQILLFTLALLTPITLLSVSMSWHHSFTPAWLQFYFFQGMGAVAFLILATWAAPRAVVLLRGKDQIARLGEDVRRSSRVIGWVGVLATTCTVCVIQMMKVRNQIDWPLPVMTLVAGMPCSFVFVGLSLLADEEVDLDDGSCSRTVAQETSALSVEVGSGYFAVSQDER